MLENYMIIPGVTKLNLSDLTKKERERQFELQLIEVSKVFNVDAVEVKKPSRRRDLVMPRQVCMTIFRKKYKVSFREAGAFFDKDHATVCHAVKTVRNLREYDKPFKALTDTFFNGIEL